MTARTIFNWHFSFDNITQPCNIVQFTSYRERFLCPLLWFEKKAPKVFLPLLRLGLDHSPKATTFLCYQSWKASLGVRYSLDDQMSLKFNIFKAIFCYFSHLLKLTFFTIFSLESRRAQASISLECETGLTNCIILAPWILTAGVLKR